MIIGAPAWLLSVAAAATPVWIDADPSVGVRHRDVDDGVALLQALRSPELEIVGVSTVFGNTGMPEADHIARSFLSACGADSVPVYIGAFDTNDPTKGTDASAALIAALEAQPLTILALGPVTNVAAALRIRPDLAPRIVEVIAVAGRLPGQRLSTGDRHTRPHRDFNFEKDAAGFQTLLDADIPLTLTPWELSRQVWIDRSDLAQWAAASPPAAALARAAEGWLGMWEERFGVAAFNPFDTLAVARVSHPDQLICAPMDARIDHGPDDTATPGTTAPPTKPYLVVTPPADGRPVVWCHTPTPAFKTTLMARITSAP